MKKHLTVLAILILIPAAALAGEPAPAPAKAEPEKKPEAREESQPQGFRFGIVSEMEVLDNLEENKDILVDIDLITNKARGVVEGMKKELKSLQGEIDLRAEGSKEREEKMKELDKKTQESNIKYRTITADIQQQAKKKRDELSLRIRDAVAQFARKQGYSMVFERSALLFGEEGKSLTTEIIDQMNAEYMFKAKKEGSKEAPKDDKKDAPTDDKKDAPRSDKKDASGK